MAWASRTLEELLGALPPQERWTKRPEFLERAYARVDDMAQDEDGAFAKPVVLDVGSCELAIDPIELRTLAGYFSWAGIPHDFDETLLY